MSTLTPRLRHRVSIQRQSNVRDSNGILVTTWVDVLTNVPAEVLQGAGREFNASGALQSEVAARVTMRWFSGLKASMRVLHDGSIYNITSAETDITGRREWRLRCAAGVNDGD